VRVYWFRTRPNFGDALAPVLLRHFGGIGARWSHPALSDGVVIGSVAARLPRHYYGVVVGVGKYDETVALDLSRAHVLGLRGRLTLRDSGARGNPVLGDSGLLARDLLAARPPVAHDLGIVPHYNDTQLAQRFPDAHHVDVGRDPIEVIREIASCERIISSSLHGLITADSLGIPRRWEPSSRLRGGAFKFHDYASALGVAMEPEKWQTASGSAVDSAVSGLRDAFREVPRALELDHSPFAHKVIQSVDSVRGWTAKQAARLGRTRSPSVESPQ
jgi:pyruvyltransferase